MNVKISITMYVDTKQAKDTPQDSAYLSIYKSLTTCVVRFFSSLFFFLLCWKKGRGGGNS